MALAREEEERPGEVEFVGLWRRGKGRERSVPSIAVVGREGRGLPWLHNLLKPRTAHSDRTRTRVQQTHRHGATHAYE